VWSSSQQAAAAAAAAFTLVLLQGFGTGGSAAWSALTSQSSRRLGWQLNDGPAAQQLRASPPCTISDGRRLSVFARALRVVLFVRALTVVGDCVWRTWCACNHATRRFGSRPSVQEQAG
jgi:hypothetical protein